MKIHIYPRANPQGKFVSYGCKIPECFGFTTSDPEKISKHITNAHPRYKKANLNYSANITDPKVKERAQSFAKEIYYRDGALCGWWCGWPDCKKYIHIPTSSTKDFGLGLMINHITDSHRDVLGKTVLPKSFEPNPKFDYGQYKKYFQRNG